ncbi:hypothetical protein FRC05_001385 [Tulasnella sp. 425]|nr:hypothetical protein FRC05_001385 [Tulasnella sp. 425]
MAESPPSDEVVREALQMFEGLDAALAAAMLDSGAYSGQLVGLLWQSWSQEFRTTVLREVQPDTREALVCEIDDVPRLTEALLDSLGVDEAKALMNVLMRKAKADGAVSLKTRVVALTRSLIKPHAVENRDHISTVPSPPLPLSAKPSPPPPAINFPSPLQPSSVSGHANQKPALPSKVVAAANSLVRPILAAQAPQPALRPPNGNDHSHSHDPPSAASPTHPRPPQSNLPINCSTESFNSPLPDRGSATRESPIPSPSAEKDVLMPVLATERSSPQPEQVAARRIDPGLARTARTSPPRSETPLDRGGPPTSPPSPPSPTVPPVDELFQAEEDREEEVVESSEHASELENDASAEAASAPATLEQGDEDARFHPKGWTAELNAKKVAEWDLEHAIDHNRRHTASARTEWMYQSRLKGIACILPNTLLCQPLTGGSSTDRTDEEYEELTASEFQKFASIPPVIRKEAGMVFNKTSKFDFEARVLLGLVAFKYCKMEPEEGRRYMVKSLTRLENRLPDISPSHPKRRIDNDGPEAVRRWWNDIKTWITTVAGKMRKLFDEKGNSVELLMVSKKATKYDPAELLGRKRAGVAYNIWGATDQGTTICNPLIKKALDQWVKENPKAAEDGRKIGQKALWFSQKIRRAQFLKQSDEVQKQFHKEAKTPDVPQTDEQRQAGTEACLPYLVHILDQAAVLLGMHIVVFMSGKTLGAGVPIIVKEFTNSEVDSTPFLEEGSVGDRAKAEYVSFAAKYHQADPAQIRVYDRSAADTIEKGGPEETIAATNKSSSPVKSTQTAKSMHRLFDPSPTLKKRGPRGDFMSKFLSKWFTRVFGGKINWSKVSRNNSQFIDLSRLPKDKDGRTVPLMNPTAMPDEAFEFYWDHLLQSTRGQLPENDRFLWHGEDLHFNLPAVKPPVDSSVHVAGEQAAKTQLGKRKRGSERRSGKQGAKAAKRSGKKRQSTTRYSDDDEDGEDFMELIQEVELGELGKKPNSQARHLRPCKKSLNQAVVAEDVDPGRESSLSGSDDDYAPEEEEKVDYSQGSMEAEHLPAVEEEEERLSEDGDHGLGEEAAEGTANLEVGDSVSGVHDVAKEVTETGDHGLGEEMVDQGVGAGAAKVDDVAEEIMFAGEEDSRSSSLEATTLPQGVPADEASDVLLAGDESMDWGPHSSAAVEEDRPLTEILLDAPTSRPSSLESPAWLRFMKSLHLWGRKLAGLSPQSQKIALSPDKVSGCTVPIPAALTSAVAIMQTWVSFQQLDPRTPEISVAVHPHLGLESVTPRHHIRQAVEVILDVTKPLPTAKILEVNLHISSVAIEALYTHFELGLVRFLLDLTHTSDTVRFSDVELLSPLRLASFILDRFVVILAGVAVVRYMEAFLGGAVEEWVRKARLEPSVGSMWRALKLLWSPAVESLSRAISVGREDLFVVKWAESHLPFPTYSILRHILVSPAWWQAPQSGVPQAFRFGTKQTLFSPLLEEIILACNWSLLTFLDRSMVLLLLFACAVQLSEDGAKEDIVRFTELLGSLWSAVNRSGTEEGPLAPLYFHDEAATAEVDDWIAVWASEKIMVVQTENALDLDIPPATPPIPPERPSQGLSEVSAGSAGRPETPTPPTTKFSHEVPQAQPTTTPVPSPTGSQVALNKSTANQDSGGEAVIEDTEDVPRAKGKRKVRVGRQLIPDPSVGAAVDPKKRLRQAVKRAEERGTMLLEEQPQRAARKDNPPVRSTPARGAKAEVKPLKEAPKTKASGLSVGRKKPVSLVKKVQAASRASSPRKTRASGSKVKGPEIGALAATNQPTSALTPAQKRAATIASKKAAKAAASLKVDQVM